MSNRIKTSDLEALVKRINAETGSPHATYSGKSVDGTLKANVGNYHLSGAYGGWALHRIANESGGASDVFNSGHVSKRELYQLMSAYLRGLETKQEVSK